MEMSLLSWLALLTFYILYVLMGGCVFNDIEYEEKYREQEAEDSREIKLIIVDLLEQVLVDDENKSSNFTSVIRRLRHLIGQYHLFRILGKIWRKQSFGDHPRVGTDIQLGV